MPTGGEGYYFFTNHFTVNPGDIVYIDLRVNGEEVCTMFDENQQTLGDYSNGGCSAVLLLDEGK